MDRKFRATLAVGAATFIAISFLMPSGFAAPTAKAGQIPQPRGASCSGSVTAFDDDRPLAGVRVRVLGTDRSAVSDDRGRFRLDEIPPGSYFVTATLPGYALKVVGQGGSPDLPVQFSPLADLNIDVRLIPLGSIGGNLSDHLGAPLSGATVRARRQQSDGTIGPVVHESITDEHGSFDMSRVVAGPYLLIAEVRARSGTRSGEFTQSINGDENAVVAYFPGTASPERARPVDVRDGEQADGSFVLEPTRLARISGRIVSTDGNPENSFVLMPQARPPQPQLAGSIGLRLDKGGTFEITGVPPGDYRLDVLDTRNLSSATLGPRRLDEGPLGEFASVWVRVSGDDIADLEITTRQGFTVTGRIINEDSRGSSLKAVSVVAYPNSDGFASPVTSARRATTDDDSGFTFTNLAGRVILRLNGLPTGAILKEVRLDTFNSIDYGVDVQSDMRVELIVGRGAVLTGNVTDSRGRAVPTSTLIVFPQDPAAWSLSQNRLLRMGAGMPDGTFRLAGLPAGRYYVAARVVQDLSALSQLSLEALIPFSERVVLADGGTQVLTVRVH